MTRPILFVVDYDPQSAALVPRAMTVLGLIGGPLLFASGIAVLFGLYEQVSVWSGIATLPIFAYKAPLGIWLIVTGFNQSVIASENSAS